VQGQTLLSTHVNSPHSCICAFAIVKCLCYCLFFQQHFLAFSGQASSFFSFIFPFVTCTLWFCELLITRPRRYLKRFLSFTNIETAGQYPHHQTPSNPCSCDSGRLRSEPRQSTRLELKTN